MEGRLQHLRRMNIKLRNLLRQLKDKLVNADRPLGTRPPKMVYTKCPPPPGPRSSVDIAEGRGPEVVGPGGKKCGARRGEEPFSAADPLSLLRRLPRAAQEKERMIAEAALSGCGSFTDKLGCERGLPKRCQWTSGRRCTEKK